MVNRISCWEAFRKIPFLQGIFQQIMWIIVHIQYYLKFHGLYVWSKHKCIFFNKPSHVICSFLLQKITKNINGRSLENTQNDSVISFLPWTGIQLLIFKRINWMFSKLVCACLHIIHKHNRIKIWAKPL